MPATEYVDYTVTDGRAEIVLDRPDVLNAFHGDMIEEIVASLLDAHSDDRVYVIVLTGNGRAFCSGSDVNEVSGDGRIAAAEYLWAVQNVVRYLYDGAKPTVAAVNGPALGAGCDFALACDLRVIASDAFLREQFVNIGLVPGDGGGWLLPRLVGESTAKEYLLTGKDITPEAASDMGLVTDVVEPGESMAAARAVANEIRDKPALAVRRTKELTGFDRSFEEYCRAAIEAQWNVTNTEEHEEALRALAENRPPEFDRQY